MTAIYTSTHAGETASRKSAGHIEQEYFFAIWAKRASTGKWTCESYSSQPGVAQARASGYRTCPWWAEVEVVPVTCTIKLTKRQRDAQAKAEADAALDDFNYAGSKHHY